MAKFLFVVPPLTGHTNPTIAVANELRKIGHEVAWVVHEKYIGHLMPDWATLFPLPNDELLESQILERSKNLRGLSSIKFLYEEFYLPMAYFTYQSVEEIVLEYEPDVMVCDQQMVSGALVARRLEIPWLTFATTSASILKCWDVVDDWVEELLAKLQSDAGLNEIVERPDLSPYGVVVFSSEELLGQEDTRFEADYHFVGPAVSGRVMDMPFPWGTLRSDRPKVLISLGTISGDRGTRYFSVMKEALADLPIQVVMVAPEEHAKNAPENFIVRERIPQLDILPHMDVVVSHAGHNTVCETLSNGLPMVVTPIRDDQPTVARQVVEAGAGVYLRFGRVSVNDARKAVIQMLTDKRFKEGAVRIQRSLNQLGGAVAVADQLSDLAIVTGADNFKRVANGGFQFSR